MTLTVALEVAPELPREELVIETRSPFQGVKVSNLSPSLADQLRLDPGAKGVVIVDVANGSLGQRLGFQPGDVVLTVNNQKVDRGPATSTSSAASRPACGGSPSGAAASRCRWNCGARY